MLSPVIRALALVIVIAFPQALSAATAPSLEEATKSAEGNFKSWEAFTKRVDGRVRSGHIGSLEAQDLRVELEKILAHAVAARTLFTEEAKKVSELLNSLGPKPEKADTPETANVAKKRKELTSLLTLYEGYAKQAGLLAARGEQIIVDIGKLSRQQLQATLFQSTVTPASSTAWVIGGPEFARLLQTSFIDVPISWWNELSAKKSKKESFNRAFLIAVAAGLVGLFIRLWAHPRYGRIDVSAEPVRIKKIWAGLVEGGAAVLAPLLFLLVVWFTIANDKMIDNTIFLEVVKGVVKSLFIVLLGHALIKAVFDTRNPQWQIADFDDPSSRVFLRRFRAALVIFAVFFALSQSFSWATLSAELESVYAFVFVIILSPLLISLLIPALWKRRKTPGSEKAATFSPALARARAFAILLLALAPVVAIFGYPRLATYLTQALYLSTLFLGVLWLVRTVGREGTALLVSSQSISGRKIREVLVLDDDSAAKFRFWIRAFFDLVLLSVGIVALLPVWEFGFAETTASAGKLIRGVQIGSFTFSLVNLSIGIALFIAIMFLTRLLQRGFEKHFLPNLTRDRGVRDALKTVVGYIGAIIAALVGVSAVGLDLTNLAYIAGALSVGLGFGLQNIVSNFISGLILLAERPIKPGDWVVIGGHEGKVKQVNVRSTEIETFQRASVIIPNADLISSPVTNWTHKNLLGRADIPVGVAYGSDVELVARILVECASQHTNVLSHPEPNALFMGFGDSSLDFELRAHLANVENRLSTAS
ncbi:MAG: mechanosensitive ion channel, partial [Rhodospirillales bacterium]|nr:mechanosensitive ion channel [Rhodospirillales bacterium]